MTTMRMRLPRFTIERLRTLVLIGAVVLITAILALLAMERLRLRKEIKDLPGRLGIDIQQQANGVDYTQTRKGKTLFKIHAARGVQMKSGGRSILHDVRIDLYGDDGQRADTISGSEFEYDPTLGVAHAAGAVEITLMRPGARPAIAELKPGAEQAKSDQAAAFPLAPGAITDNEIHVRTSGLTFNQKTQVATTDQRVDFALRQGKGNAIGATYDASQGELILNRAVELIANRGAAHAGSEPVTVHAAHGEFHHEDQKCTLVQAMAEYTGGTAQAANAEIDFRDDGSVQHMQGSGGVELTSKGGAQVTAPRGTLEFDEHNHPRAGVLSGGTKLEMNQPLRQVEGGAATARLQFDGDGNLSHAHLEEAVSFRARQQGKTAKGAATDTVRTWTSPSADIDFATEHAQSPSGSARAGRMQPGASSGARLGTGSGTRTEPRLIHGFGGVTVTSETHVDGRTLPSKLSADTVIAQLAPGAVLSNLTGNGHAHFEQLTAQGVRQSSSSDQLDVHFLPPTAGKAVQAGNGHPQAASPGGNLQAGSQNLQVGSQIDVMRQSGHVVLTQDAAPSKTGQPAQAPMRATADRSDYDGKTEILHLEGSPRVENGTVELTATRIDFARATSDVFAHGNVKASWSNTGASSRSLPGAGLLGGAGRNDQAASPSANAAANGPVHAVAAESEMHQGTQEVILRAGSDGSGEPRLWQAGSSVTAPLIILNRQKMTLQAQSGGAATPVITVLLGHASAAGSRASKAPAGRRADRQASPSTIRIRSGDLHYSEGERLALFHAGALGRITATTIENGSPATVTAQRAEVHLLPAEQHAGASQGSSSGGVDSMTATGRVTVDWPGRHGTGEKLVYRSEDGTFTLTGTAATPPRMTDRDRGTVTGSALIYHSRDDAVMVEGDGAKTSTETRSPK